MPLLRPSMALRASRTLTTTLKPQSPATRPTASASATAASAAAARLAPTAAFSTTALRRSDHAEEPYDPPTGWLWGDRPGEKYEKEGWEGIMIWGFFGSLGLAVVAYCFKPDTSIQTWALEEARRRLEAEGILKEPEDK